MWNTNPDDTQVTFRHTSLQTCAYSTQHVYANYHTTDDMQRQIELRVLHTIITDGSTLTRTSTDGAAEAFSRVTQLTHNNEALFRLLVVEAPDERFIHDWQ